MNYVLCSMFVFAIAGSCNMYYGYIGVRALFATYLWGEWILFAYFIFNGDRPRNDSKKCENYYAFEAWKNNLNFCTLFYSIERISQLFAIYLCIARWNGFWQILFFNFVFFSAQYETNYVHLPNNN